MSMQQIQRQLREREHCPLRLHAFAPLLTVLQYVNPFVSLVSPHFKQVHGAHEDAVLAVMQCLQGTGVATLVHVSKTDATES